MRFVGHLDTVRYFQKALRRSGLKPAYSNGLSPHLLVTFASPLSVGMTTEGDYIDVVIDEERDVREILSMIRSQLSEGFSLSDAVELSDHAKTPMALLRAASYQITPNNVSEEVFKQCIANLDSFFSQSQINVSKKTKKGESIVDIRPMIYRLKPDESKTGIQMQIAAGSIRHLKPELVVETLMRFSGFEEPVNVLPPVFHYHRLDLYGIKGNSSEREVTDPAKLSPLLLLDIKEESC